MTHRFAAQRAALLRVPPRTPTVAEQGRHGVVDMRGRQPRQRNFAQFARGQAQAAAIDFDGNRTAIASVLQFIDEVGEEGSRREFSAADTAALDQLLHFVGVVAGLAVAGEVLGAVAIMAIGTALAPTSLKSRAGLFGGDSTDTSHGCGPSSCVNG